MTHFDFCYPKIQEAELNWLVHHLSVLFGTQGKELCPVGDTLENSSFLDFGSVYIIVHLSEDSLASRDIRAFLASKMFEQRLKDHVSLLVYRQAEPGFGRGCERHNPYRLIPHQLPGFCIHWLNE